jgi:hypothetical protein
MLEGAFFSIILACTLQQSAGLEKPGTRGAIIEFVSGMLTIPRLTCGKVDVALPICGSIYIWQVFGINLCFVRTWGQPTGAPPIRKCVLPGES